MVDQNKNQGGINKNYSASEERIKIMRGRGRGRGRGRSRPIISETKPETRKVPTTTLQKVLPKVEREIPVL